MTTVTHDIEAVIAKYIKDAIETLKEKFKVSEDDIIVEFWPEDHDWQIEVYRDGSGLWDDHGPNLLDLVAKAKVS